MAAGRFRSAAFPLALLVLLGACGDDPVQPEPLTAGDIAGDYGPRVLIEGG